MKLGIILKKIRRTNIYIVDIGWGNLGYFFSEEKYKEKDVILYDDSIFFRFFDYDVSPFLSENQLDVFCRLKDCELLGNIRYDFQPFDFKKSEVVIGRKDYFICWKGKVENDYLSCMHQEFDLVGNSLLFLNYAEPRYPIPDEKAWSEAYTYAKKKIEELDIPQMIKEIKVEYRNISFTRRGSDNVFISHYDLIYDYTKYNSHCYYLDNIIPSYKEHLYDENDGECEYIHPQFEKSGWIRKPDGSSEYKKAKFKGLDIDTFCNKKTQELRKLAWKNYESYNKDEHITYIAYHHMNWYNINDENKIFQKMKVLGELIWGFDYQEIIEQITKDNYEELIMENNLNHPIPRLPDLMTDK